MINATSSLHWSCFQKQVESMHLLWMEFARCRAPWKLFKIILARFSHSKKDANGEDYLSIWYFSSSFNLSVAHLSNVWYVIIWDTVNSRILCNSIMLEVSYWHHVYLYWKQHEYFILTWEVILRLMWKDAEDVAQYIYHFTFVLTNFLQNILAYSNN